MRTGLQSLGGELGWSLVAFFAIMMGFGWAMGLIISGIVLRVGLGAESLAWAAIFLIQPLSGVYYPVATLPAWLQPVAWLLPTAPVFEGMRRVLREGVVDFGLLATALAVLAVWLVGAALTFLALFRSARRQGVLLQVGE